LHHQPAKFLATCNIPICKIPNLQNSNLQNSQPAKFQPATCNLRFVPAGVMANRTSLLPMLEIMGGFT
jgi:hypothetical protein